MDHWIIKQALFEQHRDRLLQEAARERLLRQARREHQERNQIVPGNKGRVVLKRRIAIGLALLILAALWAVQIAAAAGAGGSGWRFPVM